MKINKCFAISSKTKMGLQKHYHGCKFQIYTVPGRCSMLMDKCGFKVDYTFYTQYLLYDLMTIIPIINNYDQCWM